MRLLEEQKRALDSQVALKKANLEAAQDIRKLETGMANLARQVEKNAYELTGQPPVQVRHTWSVCMARVWQCMPMLS